MAASVFMWSISPLAGAFHTLAGCSEQLSSLFNPGEPGLYSCCSMKTVLTENLPLARTEPSGHLDHALLEAHPLLFFGASLAHPPLLQGVPSLLLPPD